MCNFSSFSTMLFIYIQEDINLRRIFVLFRDGHKFMINPFLMLISPTILHEIYEVPRKNVHLPTFGEICVIKFTSLTLLAMKSISKSQLRLLPPGKYNNIQAEIALANREECGRKSKRRRECNNQKRGRK